MKFAKTCLSLIFRSDVDSRQYNSGGFDDDKDELYPSETLVGLADTIKISSATQSIFPHVAACILNF